MKNEDREYYWQYEINSDLTTTAKKIKIIQYNCVNLST